MLLVCLLSLHLSGIRLYNQTWQAVTCPDLAASKSAFSTCSLASISAWSRASANSGLSLAEARTVCRVTPTCLAARSRPSPVSDSRDRYSSLLLAVNLYGFLLTNTPPKAEAAPKDGLVTHSTHCLLYTSPSPR